MLRFIALLALLSGATPVLAESGHIVGQKDGVSFNYTAELTPKGEVILRGKYLDTDEQFEMRVSRDGHVDGRVGSSAVSFDVSQKVRDQAVADLRDANDLRFAESTTSH